MIDFFSPQPSEEEWEEWCEKNKELWRSNSDWIIAYRKKYPFQEKIPQDYIVDLFTRRRDELRTITEISVSVKFEGSNSWTFLGSQELTLEKIMERCLEKNNAPGADHE